MRVLDLGCGKAKSSIFLAREFGVEVWATDLWVSASEELAADSRCRPRPRNGGRVIPIHADAHKLPYAAEFFDAITAHDCYSYFGTDDLYLNYLVQFVKPGGQIGIAGAGLAQEMPVARARALARACGRRTSGASTRPTGGGTTGPAPAWSKSNSPTPCPTAGKSGRHWQRKNSPENTVEIEAVEADAGRYLTYIRMIGRRTRRRRAPALLLARRLVLAAACV